MRTNRKRRTMAIVAGGVGLALGLAACSGTSGSSSTASGGVDCSKFKDYGTFKGTKVTAYSSIRDVEATQLDQSWADFEKCTEIDIQHEGSGEFEAQLNVRVQGGNAPDVAFFPQPGLLQRFAKAGSLKPANAKVTANADKGWNPDWKTYGTVDGTFYAAPLMANMKSFVWYSPKMFADAGYTVPTTWADMLALSQKIADSGKVPWCAGIESGDATGWAATDWLEDVLLRTAGPDVYDKWVNHTIPFNDPQIATGLNEVGKILKNDKFVNAGFGGVSSIATTSFQEAGLPILSGDCWMHRQASFYAAQFPKGTKIGADGDVFAFYLPPIDPAKGEPVLGAGEFVGAFTDRPEVQAVQEYLSSGDWANSRVKIGGVISANKGLDINNVQDPIGKLSVQKLQDPKTVFRFDGSDAMPAAVGAGTFWKAMTDWITGSDTAKVLDQVEASWPTS